MLLLLAKTASTRAPTAVTVGTISHSQEWNSCRGAGGRRQHLLLTRSLPRSCRDERGPAGRETTRVACYYTTQPPPPPSIKVEKGAETSQDDASIRKTTLVQEKDTNTINHTNTSSNNNDNNIPFYILYRLQPKDIPRSIPRI